MELVFLPNGDGRCIYDEAIELSTLGQVTIRRGSQVEPDASGGWIVDLAPVDGPKLGPFGLRSEALRAEVAWLTAHWLPR